MLQWRHCLQCAVHHALLCLLFATHCMPCTLHTVCSTLTAQSVLHKSRTDEYLLRAMLYMKIYYMQCFVWKFTTCNALYEYLLRATCNTLYEYLLRAMHNKALRTKHSAYTIRNTQHSTHSLHCIQVAHWRFALLIKLQVSFAEYSLFCRVLLQKRPITDIRRNIYHPIVLTSIAKF